MGGRGNELGREGGARGMRYQTRDWDDSPTGSSELETRTTTKSISPVAKRGMLHRKATLRRMITEDSGGSSSPAGRNSITAGRQLAGQVIQFDYMNRTGR